MRVGTIRFAPLRDTELLWREITRLAPRAAGEGAAAPTWTPPADVFDTPDAVVVRVELAGLGADDIEVEVDEDVLTVRGERRYAPPVEGASASRLERGYGRFVRAMTLPAGVRAEGIAAAFADGVLTVTVPKLPEVRPRRIAVATPETPLSAPAEQA